MDKLIDVSVVGLRLVDQRGPLKGFASVRVGDWVIHDFRIVKPDGQRAWVSPPQISWRDADGNTKYKAMISIPGELKQRIDVAVLSSWEEEISKSGKQ